MERGNHPIRYMRLAFLKSLEPGYGDDNTRLKKSDDIPTPVGNKPEGSDLILF
jgi:hypothetical protein